MGRWDWPRVEEGMNIVTGMRAETYDTPETQNRAGGPYWL